MKASGLIPILSGLSATCRSRYANAIESGPPLTQTPVHVRRKLHRGCENIPIGIGVSRNTFRSLVVQIPLRKPRTAAVSLCSVLDARNAVKRDMGRDRLVFGELPESTSQQTLTGACRREKPFIPVPIMATHGQHLVSSSERRGRLGSRTREVQPRRMRKVQLMGRGIDCLLTKPFLDCGCAGCVWLCNYIILCVSSSTFSIAFLHRNHQKIWPMRLAFLMKLRPQIQPIP